MPLSLKSKPIVVGPVNGRFTVKNINIEKSETKLGHHALVVSYELEGVDQIMSEWFCFHGKSIGISIDKLGRLCGTEYEPAITPEVNAEGLMTITEDTPGAISDLRDAIVKRIQRKAWSLKATVKYDSESGFNNITRCQWVEEA